MIALLFVKIHSALLRSPKFKFPQVLTRWKNFFTVSPYPTDHFFAKSESSKYFIHKGANFRSNSFFNHCQKEKSDCLFLLFLIFSLCPQRLTWVAKSIHLPSRRKTKNRFKWLPGQILVWLETFAMSLLSRY